MNYNVIAIEREYASGGSEIGEKLAKKLKIPCYGQEILEISAKKLGFPPDQLISAEESMTGSLLHSIVAMTNIAFGRNVDLLSIEQKLFITEADVINKLAMSSCVIVGRGAVSLLKDNGNVLKVFIHADYNARIDRAVNIYGIGHEAAESVLHRFDKRRSNYFKASTGSAWKDPSIYHMLLSSSKLGVDRAADILYETIKQG